MILIDCYLISVAICFLCLFIEHITYPHQIQTVEDAFKSKRLMMAYFFLISFLPLVNIIAIIISLRSFIVNGYRIIKNKSKK